MISAPMRNDVNDRSGPIRILHMEDDSGLAGLVRRRLSREHYQVDLAMDGEQGIAMYEATSYDLLLLDHYMPVYSGLEVLHILSNRGPVPPTIVITGRGDEHLAVSAMKLGASDYVIKDPDANFVNLLPSVIERVLETRRLRDQTIRSQEALQQREELLRLISDALPVCISYTDTDQRYVFANKTHEQWFGKPVQDIVGVRFDEVWGDGAQRKAQTYLPDMLKGRTVRYEEEFVSHDGSNRHLSFTHVPHMGTCNEVKGCVSLMSDVTPLKRSEKALREARDDLESRVNQRTEQLAASNEQLRREIRVRQRAEDQLRSSEERFRAIFETSPDYIFVKDRALRYTQVNPAAAILIGMPVSEILGRTSRDLFDEETANTILAVDRRVLNGQTVEQSVTRRIGKELISVHEVRIPLRDSTGAIVGICGISRDVTGVRRPRREVASTRDDFRSPVMRQTVARALSAAQSDSTLLLLGESGTGKDYLARYIHDRSRRSGGPFFALNCAAVARELAEAELFGHETGAFTGANRRKRGLLELAEGGTLLLNEIGDLPLPLQAKLLSFLDTRSFTRVGGETNVQVNARIMAATNCDLHEEVQQGRFRLDLFYRLNVLSITVPPLRERREDIPILVRRLTDTLAKEMRLHELPRVDEHAMRKLIEHEWPGNVRQLRNVIERAIILSGDSSDTLSFGELGPRDHLPDEWSFTVKLGDGVSINDVANQVKRALISETLTRSKGNKQLAARQLGLSRFALFRMMKALGLHDG